MRRSYMWIVLLFVLAGCGDDPTRPTGEGSLTGQVLDTSGQPIADASIGIVYQLDPVPSPAKDLENALAKATITLAFATVDSSQVTFVFEDIHGTRVFTMGPTVYGPGSHRITWNGTDDSGRLLPNGLYSVRFVWSDLEGVALQEERAELFLLSEDPQRMADGPQTTTDDAGLFEIPLADLPLGWRQEATDESGSPIGVVEVSRVVRVFAIVPGSAPLRFVSKTVTLREGARNQLSLVVP